MLGAAATTTLATRLTNENAAEIRLNKYTTAGLFNKLFQPFKLIWARLFETWSGVMI